MLLTLHFQVGACESSDWEAEYWVSRSVSESTFIFVLIALILKNKKCFCNYTFVNIHIKIFMEMYALIHIRDVQGRASSNFCTISISTEDRWTSKIL